MNPEIINSLGFENLNELKANFIDKGDHIEFKNPINGIIMVQKDYVEDQDWPQAEIYARQLRLGGFSDWKLPNVQELQTLYKIGNVCGIITKKNDNGFWSSSYDEERFADSNIDFTESTPYKDLYQWVVKVDDVIEIQTGQRYRKDIEKKDHTEIVKTDIYIKTKRYNVRCIRVASEAHRHLHKRYRDNDCFITTSVCRTLDRADDCDELMAFRNFRDTFMMKNEKMKEEVKKYYFIAPKICKSIDAKGVDYAKKTYKWIWESYLSHAFDALNNKEFEKAYEIYKSMVLFLEKTYL